LLIEVMMRSLLSALGLALLVSWSAPAEAKSKASAAKPAHAAAPQAPAAAEQPHPAPVAPPVKKEEKKDEVDQTRMATRGPTRLDFDDRLVQGQGSKAGAVYLYDRKDLPLRSMVKQRDNFRDQIANEQLIEVLVE
jgi:hypothetical protein